MPDDLEQVDKKAKQEKFNKRMNQLLDNGLSVLSNGLQWLLLAPVLLLVGPVFLFLAFLGWVFEKCGIWLVNEEK